MELEDFPIEASERVQTITSLRMLYVDMIFKRELCGNIIIALIRKSVHPRHDARRDRRQTTDYAQTYLLSTR